MAMQANMFTTDPALDGTGLASAQVMYELKEFLKSVGWTVPFSGDGRVGGEYGDGSDVITHYGSGANGFANENAWVVLRSPEGKEVLLQRKSRASWHAPTVRYSYSKGGLFSGGAANVAATAADEALAGEWEPWVNGDNVWSSEYMISASDSAPYGFCIAGHDPTLNELSSASFAIAFDPVLGAPGDDLFVLYMPALEFSFDFPFSDINQAGAITDISGWTGLRAWFDVFRQCMVHAPMVRNGSNTYGPANYTTGPTYVGNHVALMGVHYMRPNMSGWAQPGWKGLSTQFAWVSDGQTQSGADSSNLRAGDTLYTDDPAVPNWIMVSGQMAMRWGGPPSARLNRSALDMTGAQGEESDLTPPVISGFNPPAGTLIGKNQPITFEVTDEANLAAIAVFVSYPDGTSEVVFDGTLFRSPFKTSTRVDISGGYRFTVRRTGGWKGNPTLEYLALDRGGNKGVIA